MKDLQMNFIFNNRKGVINIDYTTNNDVIESGFDMLSHLGMDINMWISYSSRIYYRF